MGQVLSAPVTTKETARCENELFSVGSSSVQGWRIRMEDCHTNILSLRDDPGTAFFSVLDGHGGSKVSKYAAKNLHKFLLSRPEYKKDVGAALKQAFLDIDRDILQRVKHTEQILGSTALVVLIKDNRLYCANAGDSRAIACVKGQAEVLSNDHKPTCELERERIYAAGGWIESNRIKGELSLSRPLGDFKYKRNKKSKPEEQIVTAYPDVEIREIDENWDFIFLASDGIWDAISNKEVVDLCRKRISQGVLPDKICEEILDRCMALEYIVGIAGCDNMTAVLVCCLQKRSYADLVQRCASGKFAWADSTETIRDTRKTTTENAGIEMLHVNSRDSNGDACFETETNDTTKYC